MVNDYSIVPQEYYAHLNENIKNNKYINAHFGYKSVPGLTLNVVLSYYLINNYSTNELKSYFNKVLLSSNINSEINAKTLFFRILNLKFYTINKDIEKLFQIYMDMIYDIDISLISESKVNSYIIRFIVISQLKRISEKEIISLIYNTKDKFIKVHDNFSKHQFFLVLYGFSLELSMKTYDTVFLMFENPNIQKALNDCYATVPQELIKTNFQHMKMDRQLWKLFYMNRKSLLRQTINFSGIPGTILDDIQLAYKLNFKNTLNYFQYISVSTRFLNEVCIKYEIKFINEISKEMILLQIQKYYNDRFSDNTIRIKIAAIKSLFSEIADLPKYINTDFINPASGIHIRNVSKNTPHIQPIPSEIRLQIEQYINELPLVVKIFMHLLYEIGARFGDPIDLRISQIQWDDLNNYGIIQYEPEKVRIARIKNDSNEIYSAYISKEMYYEINDYIEATDSIRKKYNSDNVFLNENIRNQECDIHARYICNKINELIDEHNIILLNGEKWHFTTRQLRKTAASDLISDGGTLYQVQNLLHHASPYTTEIYYAQVNNETILKKNTEFFQRKFQLFMPNEIFNLYTEEERRALYTDFLYNYREVEFGICIKKEVDGTCASLGNNLCANCPKLVTGEKYRPKWKCLVNSTQQRLNELIKIYERNNINAEIYCDFREYEKEVFLLSNYKSVLAAIDELN